MAHSIFLRTTIFRRLPFRRMDSKIPRALAIVLRADSWDTLPIRGTSLPEIFDVQSSSALSWPHLTWRILDVVACVGCERTKSIDALKIFVAFPNLNK